MAGVHFRQALSDIILQLVRRRMRSRSPRDFWVENIEISIDPHEGGYLLHAKHFLRCSADCTSRVVTLDLTGTWLRVVSAKSDVADTAGSFAGDYVRAPFLPFYLKPGMKWEGGLIDIVLRWDPISTPLSCLLIPDAFPRLFHGSTSIPNASSQIRIRMNAPHESLRLGGVAVNPGRVVSFDEYLLQAVLIPVSSSVIDHLDRVGTPIVYSRALADQLSHGERTRVSSLIQNVIDCHTRALGVPARPTLVVKTPYERTTTGALPHSACISAIPSTFGLRGADTPADFDLGDQIAGVWFGAGVRIVGSRSLELEAALTLALGLRWIEFVDERDELERALVHLREGERSSRFLQLLDRSRGHLGHRTVCRNTLSLYNALRRDEPVRTFIRSFVCENWGRQVHQRTVIRAFRDMGVDFE